MSAISIRQKWSLQEHLEKDGYNPQDAEKAARVYRNTNSITRASKTFAWADEGEERNWSLEMEGVIRRFIEREFNGTL